ncbi:MAG TPA: protein kinase [Thermoanaerobaculia bacterium]
MKPPHPLDVDHWRRIEPLLDQALDLPPEERSAFLDSACADDPDLRADVEALLAADQGAGAFLDTPAGEYAPDLFEEEDVEEDLAGRLVGPYRLLREIGSGGMGTVYEAEDTRLRRRVAVKLLPPEYSREAQAKERFLREARAASAVDHPNLCTVHDVGESEGRLYIVFALYEGETLRERIRRGPLPPAEAREVALQVARGLARAHEAGIIHRDVKPANVMLPRRGEAKILDFGIARLEEDDALTRTGAAWGTPAYMSPEQARGEPVDARADVWSLGVMLYEMAAGRRPSGGEGARDPEPLERLRPDVPPELARVTARALSRDPAGRYPSAVELLADLESGATPALRGQPGRKALWFLAGALVILALFVLFRDRFWMTPTLRVAILRPVVEGRPDLPFVSSEVMDATLSTLLSLEGIQPLDLPEPDEKRGSLAETRRSNEADEVLQPRLKCQEDWCRVTLRRLRKPGGEVLGSAGPFEVPVRVESSYQLAEGLRVNLRQLYPGHPPRPESPGGVVRPEDHSAYIRLERRNDSGRRLGTADLDQLDVLLRTSPGLLGAWLLATDLARIQEDYDRALGYAARAEELAPHDPRPLFSRLRAESAAKRFKEAAATLERLTQVAPGDVRVRQAEADLLEDQGELTKAIDLRGEVARRRPTWRTLLELAMLEIRTGRRESARRRLADLLKEQPDNQYVLENLAFLETTIGDLKRAETLYQKLIGFGPARSHLTSLGFVRFLLGDYAGAVAADRRALELGPEDVLTRFNLATALEAKGDLAEARRLYRDLETELAAASIPLEDARTRMLHAQCLARLGRKAEALRIADEVLRRRPEDVQVLNMAAQLYALTGESPSALYYTDLALKNGLRQEWFTIPEFRALQKDPGFRDLLDRYRARKPES